MFETGLSLAPPFVIRVFVFVFPVLGEVLWAEHLATKTRPTLRGSLPWGLRGRSAATPCHGRPVKCSVGSTQAGGQQYPGCSHWRCSLLPHKSRNSAPVIQHNILSRLTPDAADPQCAIIVDVVLNVVLRIRGTR